MADLIRKGFNKDPSLRPGPEELLQHHAFQILGMILIVIRQVGGGGGTYCFCPVHPTQKYVCTTTPIFVKTISM